MAILSMQGVTLNLGGKALLEKADLSIEAGERVCITGRNGAGKSSLLALLSGQLQPDSGTIIRGAEKFGLMPQDVPQSWTGPVFNLVAAALGNAGRALSAAHAASGQADPALPATDNLAAAETAAPLHSNQAGRLLEHGAGWERYGEILGIIKHLGLDPEADFAALSGGTKRRVALARALVQAVTLAGAGDLILDEPTNHLDLATIAWLEDFLQRRARTLVFVSHDRAFVKNLATRLVEIDRGKLYSYDCGFDEYAARREERLEVEERHFALFDKKLAREEAWIRQGIKARRTRNMGRVRALYEMRKERAARREKLGNVSMLPQEAERSGKLVIEARDISFAYPDSPPLFSGFSTIIQRGDRIGLIGDNGSGKSTLLRVLLGELPPASGSVRHGTNLQISYFDQLRETLDPEQTVMQSVAEGNDVVRIGENTRHVAGYLQDFLFTPDRLRLPVKALSGGERNRLLLARLFTRPSNLLVLDEPTNDLDVETLELLEELICEYSGTVILVSHDRSFLDNLVTSTLALEGDGRLREYVGAYSDWLRQRGASTQSGLAAKSAAKSQPPKESPNRQAQAAKRKLSFNEQRELEQLKRKLAALPERLSALEKEQECLEAGLQDPELFGRDPQGFNRSAERLAEIENEQLELLQDWEESEARLEELKS